MRQRRDRRFGRRNSGACIATVLAVAACASMSAQDTVRITLQDALSMAGSRNIDLIRADYALRSAQARIETAQGAFQPTLTFSGGPGARYQFGTTPGLSGDQNHASETFSLGLSSTYALYSGNADRAALAQAEQLARASDVTIGRTGQTTLFAIVSAYYQVATARELIGVARENLDAERHQLEQVHAFTDAQTKPISDLYAQQATVAAAESQLIGAQRDFEVAKLAVVQLLRLAPMANYDFPAPEAQPQPDLLQANDSTLVERAISQRPDIAAERARIDAAREEIRVAEAGNAPTVGVSASFGSNFNSSDASSTFGSQLFSQNPSAGLGITLSVPLFDRDRTKAATELARIDYQNELLTMSDLRLQTSLAVRQARLDVAAAQAQLEATTRQLESSRLAVDVEQARYSSGISTLTELSLARARYVAAEGQEVQARNTVEIRRASLLLAIGTLTIPRAQPAPPTPEEIGQ
ncbi:MAG: TolC family protein [Bacteroidetes bacterium]|nr:TolC family protein [Bacteroidota bacterium]